MVRELTNHWARSGPSWGHYWYLTFEHAPALLAFAAKCKEAISFSYLDRVPQDRLHLTLDRLDHDREMSEARSYAIIEAADQACARDAPFEIVVGSLGGTSGAIGFGVQPDSALSQLREVLRNAVPEELRPEPGAVDFHAQVTIAYSNSHRVSSAEVHSAIDRISPMTRVKVKITDVTLVALERRAREYVWKPVRRAQLARGTG